MPHLLLLQDLHVKTHSPSDSFTLRIVTEMYAKTLQERQLMVKTWKVVFTLEQTMKGQRGSIGIALLSLTLVLDVGGWLMPNSRCLTPRKETWYPLYRRQSGPQGQSAWMQKVSSPTGIRSLAHPPLRKSPSSTSTSIQDVTKSWKPKSCNRLRMVKDRLPKGIMCSK
jgi:hypothetical protein